MKMMSIKDAFDPPDFTRQNQLNTAKSVQTSLFHRLRKTRGDKAGSLGWLLVRLGQPDHREYDDALEAIGSRPLSDLLAFSALVSGARAAAKAPGASELCDAILSELEGARCVVSARGGK